MRVPTPLVGCRVDRTAFDHQVRLLLIGHDRRHGVDAELVIETPFLFRDAAGTGYELRPGSGAGLAPILDLFGRTVTAVEVRDAGTLHLALDDGAELRVHPHPDFESWHLAGTGVEPITVGPGGEDGWR